MASLAAALLLPTVAVCGTSLTITFDGSNHSAEVDDIQGAGDSSSILRLLDNYATGHVQVKNSKLPSPGGDEIISIAGAPAPPAIATQMYTQATLTKMIAKYTQGEEPIDKVLAWAAAELEGFMRA